MSPVLVKNSVEVDHRFSIVLSLHHKSSKDQIHLLRVTTLQVSDLMKPFFSLGLHLVAETEVGVVEPSSFIGRSHDDLVLNHLFFVFKVPDDVELSGQSGVFLIFSFLEASLDQVFSIQFVVLLGDDDIFWEFVLLSIYYLVNGDLELLSEVGVELSLESISLVGCHSLWPNCLLVLFNSKSAHHLQEPFSQLPVLRALVELDDEFLFLPVPGFSLLGGRQDGRGLLSSGTVLAISCHREGSRVLMANFSTDDLDLLLELLNSI